jgi:predicted RNA-binding protein YlqC (UPF0109 family)
MSPFPSHDELTHERLNRLLTKAETMGQVITNQGRTIQALQRDLSLCRTQSARTIEALTASEQVTRSLTLLTTGLLDARSHPTAEGWETWEALNHTDPTEEDR